MNKKYKLNRICAQRHKARMREQGYIQFNRWIKAENKEAVSALLDAYLYPPQKHILL